MRVLLSHRHLLEWNASGNTPTDLGKNVGNRVGNLSEILENYRAMWVAPAAASAIALFIVVMRADALPVAAPILTLWLIAPLIAWWISRPWVRKEAVLNAQQKHFLRKLARKT